MDPAAADGVRLHDALADPVIIRGDTMVAAMA